MGSPHLTWEERYQIEQWRAGWDERVSVPAIYAWIRRTARHLLDRLRRIGRRKSRCGGHCGGSLPANRTGIAARPRTVESRRTLANTG